MMLARIVAVSALGGFLFGYDLGLISGALELIVFDLGASEVEEELIVAGAKLGAFAGAFIGAALMLSHGRRPAISLSAVPYILGPVLMAFSPNVWLLTLGRLLSGVGVGMSAVVVPTYLAEVAPAAHRGAIVSIYEVMLTVGSVASMLVDLAASAGGTSEEDTGETIKDAWRWRIMVGAAAIPALALPAAQVLVPESARWLIMKGDMGAALAAINRLRGGTAEDVSEDMSASDAVNYELMELWTSVERVNAEEEELRNKDRGPPRRSQGGESGGIDAHETNDQGASPGRMERVRLTSESASDGRSDQVGWDARRHLLSAPTPYGSFPRSLKTVVSSMAELATGEERYPFWLAIGLAFFNQAVASTSIINYSSKVLEDAGVESDQLKIVLSIVVMLSKGIGVAFGAFAIDRLGRRPLFIAGAALIALSMVGLFVAVRSLSAPWTVASMCAFMFAFAASWAGGFWVIVSEVFSMRIKASAQAVSTAGLFLFGALTDAVFLEIMSVPGAGGFLVFAIIAAGGGMFVYLLLPETRGRTLEEVQAIFKNGARAQIRRDKMNEASGDGAGPSDGGIEIMQLRGDGTLASDDAAIDADGIDIEDAALLSS